MERIIEQGILYDFYGPLLTKHQQEIYEAVVYENFSLGEIAAEKGISRQGVHDLIRRCDKILADYEAKLHLVERFEENQKKLIRLRELVNLLTEDGDMKESRTEKAQAVRDKAECKREISKVIEELLEELD